MLLACCGASLRDWYDVDHAATTSGAELDTAFDQGEQGVILAATNTGTGVEVGATLADDDLACIDGLTAEALDA